MGREITRRLRAVAGGLRADLFRFPVLLMPPMDGPRPLRRLPHCFFGALALLLLIGAPEYRNAYGIGEAVGLPLALAQAVAVGLGLYRPMLGWWVSTATFCVAAWAIFPPASTSAIWPWPVVGLVGHTAVQLLLALRMPLRVTAQTLAVVLLLTVVTGTYADEQDQANSVVLAVVLFVLASVVGAALHGRREARSQLRAQQTLTAEERARRTLLEERSRIARELHDVVAHHMSVISIQAEAAPYRVPDPPEELTRSFAVIRTNAVEALAELRRVLGVLRSETADTADTADPAETAPPPDRPSGPAAPQPSLARLDDLVANVRTAGLDVTTTVTGRPAPLPPGVELSAYRIVQEALSNALRHAPGSRVRVELDHGADGIRVRVGNTAPGQPPEPSAGTGHGLLGMRERTAMLGGGFSAGPTPDGGYRVTAFLPREPGNADPARDHDPRHPPGGPA